MSTRKNNRRYVIEVSLPNVQTRQHYTFEENDVVIIGRAYGSDIVVKDDFVSLEHLQIMRDEKGFLVRDISSLNGTIVHKKHIKNEDALLESGQECRLGRTRLRIYSADHQLGDTLTLNWGTKLQPLLSNVFVSTFLFVLAISDGLFYGWLIKDPDSYFKEDVYKTFFLSIFAFLFIFSICYKITNTHRGKSSSYLQVSIASMIFIFILNMLWLVVPYFYFYVPNTFIKRVVDCLLIIPGTVLLGAFCSYLNEGRLRLKNAISFFFLSLFIVFAAGPLPTEYDSVPRYPSTLMAVDMPVSNPQSIDEFLENSQDVFVKGSKH